MISQDQINELNRIATRELASLFPQAPNSIYWECNGYQYHYTTERVNGKFWAMIYKPVGKGARTGAATTWKLTKKIGRVKRKDARALALKWYHLAKD